MIFCTSYFYNDKLETDTMGVRIKHLKYYQDSLKVVTYIKRCKLQLLFYDEFAVEINKLTVFSMLIYT